MAYVLPRAFFVLIAWAMTCVFIRNLWPTSDPIIFGVVGAVWLFGAIAYFSYLQKLRRDIAELEHHRYGVIRQRELLTVGNPAAE